MKVTKKLLTQIINEEIALMIESGEIDEGILDRMRMSAAGVGQKVKGATKAARQRAQARTTGMKAKAVGALGGDASRLQQKAGEQAAAAQATKAGGQQAAKIAQAKKLLGIKVKQISKLNTSISADAQKMGISDILAQPLQVFEQAVVNLVDAIEQVGQETAQDAGTVKA